MGYIPPAPYGFTHEDNAPSRQDEDRRNAPKVRVATVHGALRLAEVQAYLPDNYGAVKINGKYDSDPILIVGIDNAGWTLDGYVIPRLASGLIFATEVK